MTGSEFDLFAALPENTARFLELIEGDVVEIPLSDQISKFSVLFASFIVFYLANNNIGHVTAEAVGYKLGEERYLPSVAFISHNRQRVLVEEGFNPHPPELAVEIVWPGSRFGDPYLRKKFRHYDAAGTLVWAVLPEQRQIEVYTPGNTVEILGDSDVLTGGSVLPGFRLKLKVLFGTGQITAPT